MKMKRSGEIRKKLFVAFMLTFAFCAISASSTQLHGETVFANLDQVSGWESCTVCAGANGNGATAKYAMTQNVASPSIDGRSARFSVSGSKPYSDALWWKQLGPHNTATNFVYDLSFYYTNLEWTPKMRQPVNSSNPWNGEYWDDVSEKVFQGV
jgi:hypothetical protein